MKAKIFLTGLAFVAVTALASSIYPVSEKGNGNGSCNGIAKCSAFVDANKNGICDTYENGTTTASGRKGNGTENCVGTGQRHRNGKGKGRNFVDANKNGICDTYESQIKK